MCVPATRSVQAIKYNAAAAVPEIKWISSFGGLRNRMLLVGNKEQTEFRSLGKLGGALCERRHDPDPSAGTEHPPGSHPSLENTAILTYAKRVLFVCFYV